MCCLQLSHEVDELSHDGHYNMVFVEFLEALCRVADIAAVATPIID